MGDPLPADPPRHRNTELRCPRGGGPLSDGYLAVAGRVNWVDEPGAFDASPFKGETILGLMDIGFATAGHLAAKRCEECSLIVLEY